MLKWLFTTASYLCFLLLLTPTVSHANDYYIDFIGSTVIISPNDGSEAVVVNVDHLMSEDDVDVNLIANTVLDQYKRKQKDKKIWEKE